jgi:hypothetical protein
MNRSLSIYSCVAAREGKLKNLGVSWHRGSQVGKLR